jgi:hypothetical protein
MHFLTPVVQTVSRHVMHFLTPGADREQTCDALFDPSAGLDANRCPFF